MADSVKQIVRRRAFLAHLGRSCVAGAILLNSLPLARAFEAEAGWHVAKEAEHKVAVEFLRRYKLKYSANSLRSAKIPADWERRIADDFKNDRTFIVDGWNVSETEGWLCAIGYVAAGNK